MNARALLTLCTLLAVGTAPAVSGGVPSRDDLIRAFVARPVGTVPAAQATGRVREYTLDVRTVRTEVSPGVTVEQWAFGIPGQPATVPGPELRARVGDLVRITLVNTHTQPHTVHLHGITSLAQEMDGVPHTSAAILPGQSYTYEFVATEAGTHAYHCHMQTNLHLDMGMYGALVIEPREGQAVPWTGEHTVILDEWDSRQSPDAAVHDPHPDLFLVNGRTFPLIPDVHVPEGQTDVLRVIHMGAAPHSLHLHGHAFLVIAKDGHDLPAPYAADTLPVLPGERYDVLVKGRDGTFPLHDHNTAQNVNRGEYPGGQHLMVTGGPARRADGTSAPVPTPGRAGLPAHDHAAPPAAPAAEAPARHDHAAPATPDVPAGSAVIRISNFEYAPGDLHVAAGQRVTWINADPVIHHVVLTRDGRDEVHELPAGGSFTVTFDRPGEFRYRCQPHPFMRGVVHVN
ncbi:multicopper oxidase domain-containing protein [uncultured Deinococcus sp.]|uniref:multicopper oxidase family protein n=1 Tax=uncultured Deinococcus sp. TaxID=158789 RepID=UPI0025F4D262|nr:multicopper oxidase domain-containing protein [uncultured Deinococcus sp.]